MSKSLSASKKVMKNYLSELLTDTDVVDSYAKQASVKPLPEKPVALKINKTNKSLETLLKKVSEPEVDKPENIKLENAILEKGSQKLTTRKSQNSDKLISKKSYRQGNFQAMFFDVAGLIIAVPLIELGGIHKVDKINSLMGKPDWFKGVMLCREDKINVVDTAMWVMPEKCDENLKKSLNYQYIIMLKDSAWGLMAENLVDTVILSQDEVKWLDSSSKRPWLAGLVKEKMCALLNVEALIQLLDDGSGIYQE
ncbi:chemotaxis protein CheW [Colwelliaceae bacterium MEBiC 14330]